MSGSPRSSTMTSARAARCDDDRFLAGRARRARRGRDCASSCAARAAARDRLRRAGSWSLGSALGRLRKRTHERRAAARACPRSARGRRARRRAPARSRGRARSACGRAAGRRSGTPRRSGSRASGGTPGPWSATRQFDNAPSTARCAPTRISEPGGAKRSAFSSRFNRICSTIVTSSATSGRSSATSRRTAVRTRDRPQAAHRVLHESGDVDRFGLELERAGADAAQLERVADESFEPFGFVGDRSRAARVVPRVRCATTTRATSRRRPSPRSAACAGCG